MKLIIIRHGDPDYTVDSLTERGFNEAELLADRISQLDVSEFFCSTLGRAMDTAKPTLKRMNRTAEYCEWLREFSYETIDDPEQPGRQRSVWDFHPDYWTKNPQLYTYEGWLETDIVKGSGVPAAYKNVCSSLDEVLSRHGYNRCGRYYTTQCGNDDTVVIFCHLGTEAVLMSHLLSVSPLVFSQGFFTAPTSVTTLITEERREGIAAFRCQAMGDISHLYKNGVQPSFSGRFCEKFADDTRH